jgi:hypothetical protein
VDEMEKVLPADAVLPRRILAEELWDLDVDSALWRDPALDDDQDDVKPGWKWNPNIRRGIRAMLVVDRCTEEEQRLREERRILQQVAQKTSAAILYLTQESGHGEDEDLLFSLHTIGKEWTRRIARWRRMAEGLRVDLDVGTSWGDLHEHYGESDIFDGDQDAEVTDDSSSVDDETLTHIVDQVLF